MDPYVFVRIIVRYRTAVAAIVIASLAVSVALCFALPHRYTSSVTILSPDGAGNALQRSFGTGVYNSGMRGWVLPRILGNEDFLLDALRASFTVWDGSAPKLLSIASLEGKRDRGSLLDNADRYIHVSADEVHGSVRLGVETPYPDLSYKVARYMLAKLESYADEKRNLLRGESAVYFDSRIEEARNGLVLAESELGAFLSNNREWLNSDDPGTRMELQRLQRKQEIYSQVYFELHKQREIDDLNALSLVPSLEVLDHPVVPSLKSYPQRKIIVVFGGILGVVLSIAVAFTLDLHRRTTIRRKIPISF